MAGVLAHACRCGRVRVAVEVPSRRAGTRVTCYCGDCQATARLAGDPDSLLTPAGGTDIWQTTPDLLRIEQGADGLEVRRLSPRGLFRWHAACCDTPLFNTLERLGFPFVGLVLRPDEATEAERLLGPVVAHVFTASAPAGRGAPARDRGFGRTGVALLSRAAVAALSGRSRRQPLADAARMPIAPVRVLEKAARDAARLS